MGRRTVHEDVFAILPWFVNESLADKERQGVLAHLQDCPDCRLERDRLQALQQMVAEDDGTEVREQEWPFRRLMQRITVAERNRASTGEVKRRRRVPVYVPFVAVAASLVLAIALVAVLNRPKPGPEEYRTLSYPSGVQGVPHRIALTFEQPIQASTLRAALIETHSDIVSGPDKNGTYIVEIPVPPNMSDHRFIESLRRIKGVKNAAFEDKATHLSH